jgi:hypothetical protein
VFTAPCMQENPQKSTRMVFSRFFHLWKFCEKVLCCILQSYLLLNFLENNVPTPLRLLTSFLSFHIPASKRIYKQFYTFNFFLFFFISTLEIETQKTTSKPECLCSKCSVVDPDPDTYVFGPPGSGSGSVSQRYGSGSF